MTNTERPSRRSVFAASAAVVAAAGCTTLPALAAPDPLLRLAADFHREHVHFNGLPADASNDENETAWRAWADAAAACYATSPQTPAGALAFVTVMIDREQHCVDNELMAGLRVLQVGLAAMVAI